MLDSLIELLQSHPWWWFCGLHLTLGRAGSVVYALASGLSPWIFIPVAMAVDVAQVPLWWALYNAASRQTMRLPWLASWVDRREGKTESGGLWQRLGPLGTTGVVILAALPFWGCGMWTSTLLAWTLGMRLRWAIWPLAAGGLLGLFTLLGLGVAIKALLA